MQSVLKKHKLLILFLILVYGWYFLFQYKPPLPPQNVLGAKNNLILIQEPDDGREPILEAIREATREIHVEVYLLSDSQIVEELIREDREGTDVRVLLEEHPFGGGNINKVSSKKLSENQVEVRWANPAYPLTHEKAMIIDDKKALILNQNLTKSAFDKNREYNIIDENLEHVAEIERMFEADWERKSFTPNETDLIISPYNSRSKLTSLINNATESINIEMEILQDPEIGKTLMEKAKTTQIRIIIPDLKKIPSNFKLINKLKTAGIEIRELGSPYLHAKLIIIDDIKAYIGSVNFSTQSMDKNRELGIIVSQSDVVQTLSETFETDWAQALNFE